MAPAKAIAEEKMKEYKDEIIRPAIPTPNKSDNVASREMEGKAPIVPHPPPLSSNLGKNPKSHLRNLETESQNRGEISSKMRRTQKRATKLKKAIWTK